jgi:hypothetical protein
MATETNVLLRTIFSDLITRLGEKISNSDCIRHLPRQMFRERMSYSDYDLTCTDSVDVMLRTVDLASFPRFQRCVTVQLYSLPGTMLTFVPIGEYGPSWAEQVALGCVALSYLAVEHPETNLREECAAIDAKYAQLLTCSTFQKRALRVMVEGLALRY